MKKILFSILLMTPVWAIAAEKCIKLDTSAKEFCGPSDNVFPYGLDWNAICPSSNGIPVRGIGICASTKGQGAEARDSLEVSSNASENIYCWCKMLSPAVSRWVQIYSEDANYCTHACANDCGAFTLHAFSGYESFLQNLLSNLKD